MSRRKKATTSTEDSATSQAAVEQAAREKTSGRVTFDPRGDAVWEWRTGDGQFKRDASTTMLRRLEAPELCLEPTVIIKKQPAAPAGKAALSCGGYDPYESGAAGRNSAPAASHPAAARQSARPVVHQPRKESGVLQRLKTWVRGRQSVNRR
jgi:hypothetical protein